MDDYGDDDLGWLSSTSGDDGLSWLWDLGSDVDLSSLSDGVVSNPAYSLTNSLNLGNLGLQGPEGGSGYSFTSDGGRTPGEGLYLDDTPLPNLSSMGGGQGLSYDVPGGTVTSLGFIPEGSERTFGNPDSWIFNPQITGRPGAVSGDRVTTPNRDGTNTTRTPAGSTGSTRPNTSTSTGSTSKNGMDLKALLPWLLMLMAMKDKGGSSSNQATIPQLSATRNQTPYSQQFPPGRRPGSSAIQYFQDPQTVKYAAQGGIMGLAAGGAVPGFASGGDIDYSAYLAANPDVAAAVASGAMTAADHYNNFGRYEGRDLGGGTSGAQQNYWDSNEWGGTRASGIQSTGTPTFAGNLPSNASFYVAPASFEGNDFNVNLTATDWANVQRNVANGMSYNEAVIRASGDGLGSARIIHDSESGYLPYGVDVITGRPTTANASYSQTVNGGLSSGMYGGVTAPDGTVSFPGGPVTGGSGNSGTVPGTIPGAVTSALVKQTPYTQITQKPGYRPGQGGVQYFEPVKYAAAGGIMGNAPSLGRYAAGGIGRLVAGPGDGVSDDVPASIEGEQPAMIARGEYVIPARVVAELGNGSTEAGAERLDQMVAQIEAAGRKAGRGEDSGAHKVLPV